MHLIQTDIPECWHADEVVDMRRDGQPAAWTGFAPWGSGYDFIDGISPTWRTIASWGRDGWDMGDWPYVVVAYRASSHHGWLTVVCIEGDLSIRHHVDEVALTSFLDAEARRWWTRCPERGPDDLDSDAAKGWYGAKRRRETEAA
jgi:hypothetical protein